MDLITTHDRGERDPVPAYTSNDITVLNGSYPGHVKPFFAAIASGNADLVTSLLDANPSLVQYSHPRTRLLPLYAATVAGRPDIVALLAQYGAPINQLSPTGKYYYDSSSLAPIMRTPLMAAASQGSLPLVKLLFNDLKADDSIVAPDGAIALRLAISGRHSAVVALLPSRRRGGWRRFKHSQRKAIRRIRQAGHSIYRFTRVFVWNVPKFFLWSLPKYFLWHLPKEYLPKAIKVIPLIPSLLYKLTKWFVRGLWRFIVATPRLIIDTIEFALRSSIVIAKWVFNLVTQTIPHALLAIGKFVIRKFADTGSFMLQLLKDVVSFFHTLITAIITFFKAVTLQDVANALFNILVSIPKWIWTTIQDIVAAIKNGSFWVWTQLGGLVQAVVWLVCALVVYIPKKMGQIAIGIGEIAAAGAREIAWWFNPKSAFVSKECNQEISKLAVERILFH